MANPTLASAIVKINKAGALLLFPIKDKPKIPSLWSAFYAGAKMDWDWSEDGDNRVPLLWHLRTKLSTSNKVVYSKWLRNRATFFSMDLFTALLSLVSSSDPEKLKLAPDAKNILDALNDDSPQPSKHLKYASGMEGKENNSRFERAIKQLWQKFLIVGYGEIDEGGYPSLAIGSSSLLFEDLWDASKSITQPDRRSKILEYFPAESDFFRQYLKIEAAFVRSE